jgi:phosphoglycolate phosphatase
MQDFPQAVFFDVDGVLIDSLPQHLQICRDKSVEFGLRLRIPTVEEFRELVRGGMKVSPMRNFFLAVGFPVELVDRAVADYEREFMERYRPKAFNGVDRMLRALRLSLPRLGLVTSNTRANVTPPLINSMECFDDRCLFFFDSYPIPKAKAWCLAEGGRLLGIRPDECVYVGDQPNDARAAIEAGVRFLGVTYGWGISDRDQQYPRAKSVLEIPDKLIDLRIKSKAHNSDY